MEKDKLISSAISLFDKMTIFGAVYLISMTNPVSGAAYLGASLFIGAVGMIINCLILLLCYIYYPDMLPGRFYRCRACSSLGVYHCERHLRLCEGRGVSANLWTALYRSVSVLNSRLVVKAFSKLLKA